MLTDYAISNILLLTSLCEKNGKHKAPSDWNFGLYSGIPVFRQNCLNSGIHEVQNPALLLIFSSFWRFLAYRFTHFFRLFRPFASGQLTSLYIVSNQSVSLLNTYWTGQGKKYKTFLKAAFIQNTQQTVRSFPR